MATLTGQQLAEIRRRVVKKLGDLPASKSDANAALQAIETWSEGQRPAVVADIEAAAPMVFSAREKAAMIAFYLYQKAAREEAGL